MTDHPIADDTLIAYAGDELDAAAAARVAAHVAGCAACAATVTRFRLVRAMVRADERLAPPAATVNRAKALFRRSAPAPRVSPLDVARRLVATLTFDSWSRAALAGVRGGGEDRFLAYASDAADVEVQVEPLAERAAGRWLLIGQVSSHTAAAPIDVLLTRPGDDEPVAAVGADEHGAFALETAAGAYDLQIRLPDALVTLPMPEIG